MVRVRVVAGSGRARRGVVVTATEGGSVAFGFRSLRVQGIRVLVDTREGTRVRVWRALGREWVTVDGFAALSDRFEVPGL